MPLEQYPGQRQNVPGAIAQSRDVHRKHIEPVVKILTKSACGHFLPQVAIGGGQHTHVQRYQFVAAESFDFFFLQYPQQFCLQAQVHFRNLIKQQRAASGLFKFSCPGLVSAGIGTFFVAKEHGLQHRFRNRCAIDGDKGLFRTSGMLVDEARDYLLARTGFTADQHRRGCRRHATGQLADTHHGRVFGNHSR